MLFTAEYGNENFPSGSCKAYIFLLPKAGQGGPQIHVFQAARSKAQGVEIRSPENRVRAHNRARDFDLGQWSKANFDTPEGTIFKLWGARKTSETNLELRAAMLIRFRAGAALRVITMGTTRSQSSHKQEIRLVEGRFDILSVADAVAAGALVDHHTQQFAGSSHTRLLFTEAQIAPEEAPQTQIVHRALTNTEGAKVVIQTPRRGRVFED